MNLDLKYPAISDLRKRAKRRIPHFAFEYLDSATGSELGVKHNRGALDAIKFMPAILPGKQNPQLSRTFMGSPFDLPIGIAPVGMSGMIWPGAEKILAKEAATAKIPYSMSTVAAADPEDIMELHDGMGWFQLYAPAKPEIRRDMLRRVKEAGFNKLVLTVDVPGDSRRERQRRAFVAMPPKITAPIIWAMIKRPLWCFEMLRVGAPRMKFAESYVSPEARSADPFVHAGRLIRGHPDWDDLKALRQEWDGDLIAKGVLIPDDAVRLLDEGVDAIWVSNHTGRQFEAAPAAITQLPKVRAAVGTKTPIIFDSGVNGGLDILRALALGADMVFLGKAFHFAVAAYGAAGVRHLIHILTADMRANMEQMGVQQLSELSSRLV